MILGYNTNGFAHHRLEDAIEILASIGFQSIALTVDYQNLEPGSCRNRINTVKDLLVRHDLKVVVETGARFLLDPFRKHSPTLLSETKALRQRRIDFLNYCTELTSLLGGRVVSLWSGAQDISAGEEENWTRLVTSLKAVLQFAEKQNVIVGFEPEPGMFIDTMDRFEELLNRCDHHPALKLTLDVGHLHCLGEVPIENVIQKWSKEIVNVHIEDMKAGVHDHLMFGEGEMEFGSILTAMNEVGYQGGIHVELSRHSHNAVNIAKQSFDFLTEKSKKLS